MRCLFLSDAPPGKSATLMNRLSLLNTARIGLRDITYCTVWYHILYEFYLPQPAAE